MTKNTVKKNLLAALLIIAGLAATQLVFAQDLGINAVNNGLGNSLSATDPRVLAGRIINIALGFLGVIAVGLIIYAGFIWTTSNGEEEKIAAAKKILKNSVIGLAIILSAWGIATFILSRLGGLNDNGSSGCYDGQLASCGCGGSMTCSGGSYGGCVGSDCTNNPTKPTSCDGNTALAGCQATDQICASSDYCDHNTCACKTKGSLGDSCNADATSATCQADNNRCADYLTCNAQTCTCYGPPVITAVSPVGGFCADNANKSCNQDSDCSTACNLTAPNGTTNNLITITGTNFGSYSATSSQVIFEGSSSTDIVKTGDSYTATNRSCAINPGGGATGSCSNAYWDYTFTVAQTGAYQVAVATTNSNSSPYGDLDSFAPATGAENTCSAAGVQHHLNIYVDGQLQGSVCNPAVGPDKTHQVGTVSVNSLTAGTHTIRVAWDNDWTYNPDQVWGDKDDADSNLNIYQVSLTAGATVGKQPSTLNSACINTWTNNQIVIAVPAGVTNGPIKVVNKDSLSDATDDTTGPAIPNFQTNTISRPGLCALSPVSGTLSTAVNYTGVNLYAGSAYFGNYQNNVQALQSNFTNPTGLTGTSTTPNIKEGTSGSFVQNSLNGIAEKSNYLVFTKEAEPNSGPFISSFTPTSGASGQYVTIHGSGFGGARGTNQVYFGNAAASYDFPAVCANSVWSDNQIIVKVPSGLADGNYTIKVSLASTTIDTTSLSPSTFQADKNAALKTSLCKIEPDNGPAATPVSLWGEYFGRINDNGLVKFYNDEAATGTIQQDGTADLIKTTVPLGAITGPVRVINNSTYGNELNFNVGACTTDADCGTQVCCPQSTYKKGRCVSTLADCLINIPTSVFTWSFNTGFSTSTPNPYGYSCSGLASYYGACQTGDTCPNTTGTCSPNSGGIQSVGKCDSTCASVAGCSGLAPNNCSYDSANDLCLKNGTGANCDLAKILTYTVGAKTASTTETCNANGHWQAIIATACPTGWSKSTGNICINTNSSCSLCSANFQCQGLPANPQAGRCVSAKICPAGATCQTSTTTGGQDQCVKPTKAICDCCCPISPDAATQAKNDQANCCSFTNKLTGQAGQLTCQGRCGSDIGKTTTATLGKCGGCAAAGDTAAERDAACNCTGHSGQYCDTANPLFPSGVCTDCSDLNSADCSDHSAACCLDAKKTKTDGTNVCRGGVAIATSTTSSLSDVGFCAYYNCQNSPNSTLCATSTPVKNGSYADAATCSGQCLQTNNCSTFTSLGACENAAGCCYDAQATNGPKCRSGNKIPMLNADHDLNNDYGYCAYYNCQASPNNKLCATSTPVKNGPVLNNSIDACVNNCANQPYGPNLSCGQTGSVCTTDVCNYSGFSCLSDSSYTGALTPPNCGTCCCQPGATTTSPFDPSVTWTCLANKGSCSGTGRGLFCGCQKDSECGFAATMGCGADTCCESRPKIVSTSPTNLANNVCRNAALKVTFNTPMDAASFSSNVILLEERDYGTGVCPTGTFLTKADDLSAVLAAQQQNWLERFWRQAINWLARLTGHFSESALAGQPNPSKLYCSVPGLAYGNQGGDNSSLFFAPSQLLDASANYYLVIKGDENLNSKTGVLSLDEVGFNGTGYCNNSTLPCTSAVTNVSFNNVTYTNSQIIAFSTLSDQGANAGLCAVDNVQVSPSSYLFQTTDNALTSEEDDSNASSSTFDTVADRDKVFSAEAYSADGQTLQPVTGSNGVGGYYWTWNFSPANSSVIATSSVLNLPSNETLVTAQKGTTDGESKLTATIKMAATNAITAGDGFNNSSDIYVFICNNPWPPVGSNGSWSPWIDNSSNCLSNSGSCLNGNYKFYYCRDAGTTGTQDDLPAITNQAVIRGTSLICSSDNSACASSAKVGDACSSGAGVCVWSVLKESYFFRAAAISGPQITSATDQASGGAVKVSWQSDPNPNGTYKIYYLPSGQSTMLSTEVKSASACIVSVFNHCTAVITGLTNNTPYIFQVSVVSANKIESPLSSGVTVTPTDQTPPAIPTNFQTALTGSSTLKFTWATSSDAVIYRLYRGVAMDSSGHYQYGESFDAAAGQASLSLSLSHLAAGNNYFALTAVDSYKNESAKSTVISLQDNLPDYLGINGIKYYPLTADHWWYQAANLAATPSGRACLVKLNVDAATSKVICNDNSLGTSTQWFSGSIVETTSNSTYYPYCSTTQCAKQVNPDKCRWLNGLWTDQCYIHD